MNVLALATRRPELAVPGVLNIIEIACRLRRGGGVPGRPQRQFHDLPGRAHRREREPAH